MLVQLENIRNCKDLLLLNELVTESVNELGVILYKFSIFLYQVY
jgi:hypothetical protein